MDYGKVYRAVEEFREVERNGWGEGDAHYYIYRHRGAQRLRSTVQQVASRHGFDLVMDRQAVRLKQGVQGVSLADITAEVVRELGKR